MDKIFWNNRYHEKKTGWDIGHPSPPIKEYIDQLSDKNTQILIPGCGNAYEAEYLFNKGYENVFLLDIAPLALQQFSNRVNHFPKKNLIESDFFQHEGKYDLILEQTFFCAIKPTLRNDYVQNMHKLLKPKGKLVGLLFAEEFGNDHPPFGGTKEEYEQRFKRLFDIKKIEIAYNSIEQRKGRELFIHFIRQE